MAAGPPPVERLHAVVLCGGSGTRFWPLSRDLSPKQMLRVFDEESLVVRTIERARPLAGGGVLLLTGESLREELRDHLANHPAGPEVSILAEPSPRNTAAAIALAAAYVEEMDPGALIAVLPSDHILEGGEMWEAVVREAAHLASDGFLVTIGLRPTAPETGYGYIQAGAPVAGHGSCAVPSAMVARFVEKPDAPTAAAMVADGSHLWNSGMLVAPAAAVLSELEAAGARAATPDSASGAKIAAVARAVAATEPDEWAADAARDSFDSLPAVPFDKAVLEVSDRVAVIPAELEWSDVGSLLSVERLASVDASGNHLVGRCVDVGSTGTTVYATDRLVATLGLRDALVVDTADATLVTTRDRAQDVRLVVEALRAQRAPEVERARTVTRPWGHWTLLMRGSGFQIKSIVVEPGRRLSLQTHARRTEHWVVVRGTALVTRGDVTIEVPENESVFIPLETAHRLANPGDTPLEVVEVAVGAYLEEDDIVRVEDDWGR